MAKCLIVEGQPSLLQMTSGVWTDEIVQLCHFSFHPLKK